MNKIKTSDLLKTIYKNTIKDTKEFVAITAKEGFKMILMMYSVPTTYRIIKNYQEFNSEDESSLSEKVGRLTGTILGITTAILGPIEIAEHMLQIDYSNYGVLPLFATNILSGVYELGRNQYIKAKSQLEKQNKENH